MLQVRDFFFRRYIPKGDTMKAVFHRHFFVALPNILFWLILPIGAVAWAVYKFAYPEILEGSYIWLWEAYLFLMFVIMLYKILDWYCDAWIVTERGVVDVEWSLFTQDVMFTEFDDISAVQTRQGSIIDKIFKIGDISIHKHGEEMMIARIFKPDELEDIIQANLHAHHHATPQTGPNGETHIYLDGVRQNSIALPYKNGFRYVPNGSDEQFIEAVKKQPGTIDLTQKEEEKHKKPEHHDKKHGHH